MAGAGTILKDIQRFVCIRDICCMIMRFVTVKILIMRLRSQYFGIALTVMI